MGLTKVGIERGGAIIVEEDGVKFEVPVSSRTQVTTTEELREKLNEGKVRPLKTEVSFFSDSDDNKYVITGPTPSQLPDPVKERAEESKRR